MVAVATGHLDIVAHKVLRIVSHCVRVHYVTRDLHCVDILRNEKLVALSEYQVHIASRFCKSLLKVDSDIVVLCKVQILHIDTILCRIQHLECRLDSSFLILVHLSLESCTLDICPAVHSSGLLHEI